MTTITTTVREDSPREHTVIVHDEHGNEVGSLVISAVPVGLAVDGWHANDTHAGQMILRGRKEED